MCPNDFLSPSSLGKEGVATIHYAGFWVRVVAYMVDFLVLTLIESVPELLLVGAATSVLMDATSVSLETTLIGFFALEAAILLVSIVIAAIYFVGFWARWGQSPGKMMVGIRILQADGSRLGLRAAAYRYFVGYGVATLTLGIGFLAAAFHPRKQGWHDRIAHTVVVRTAGAAPGTAQGTEALRPPEL